MCHLFIHSLVNGHLGCFHVLATVNNTTVNTGGHESFRTKFSPDICPGVGLLDHMVVFCFLRNLHTVTSLDPCGVEEMLQSHPHVLGFS